MAILFYAHGFHLAVFDLYAMILSYLFMSFFFAA